MTKARRDDGEMGPMGCPIRFSLELIGDRWSIQILRDMLFLGHTRFRDLQGSVAGISSSMLSTRLNQLLDSGLIERFAEPGDEKAVVYLPTTKGIDLTPVMVSLIQWGHKYNAVKVTPPELRDLDSEGIEKLAKTFRRRVGLLRRSLSPVNTD